MRTIASPSLTTLHRQSTRVSPLAGTLTFIVVLDAIHRLQHVAGHFQRRR